MNRFGASKATPSTLCQKCLKRGHYSYECTASQQERPYISRPSRTQQLLNPKLKPSLTEAKLVNEKTDKKEAIPAQKKRRSPSVSSSDSVSSISTNRSCSPPMTGHMSRRASSTEHGRRHTRPQRTTSRSPQASKHRQRRDYSESTDGRRSPPRDSDNHRTRQSRPAGRDASRDRSRSPYRGPANADKQAGGQSAIRRQRSLSPYSKRIALSRR